jgi:hypothetical protein
MAAYLSALGVGTIAFWTIGLVRVLLFGPPAGAGAPLSGLFVLVPFTFVVALLTTVVPFIVLRALRSSSASGAGFISWFAEFYSVWRKPRCW